MRFIQRKRRQPPAIIIVSLIDILIVLLIFMMVTTTFKQQPAIKLALPESREAKEGAKEDNLTITVSKTAPFFYLGPTPMALDQLSAELARRAKRAPDTVVTLRADKDATFGNIMGVMDAAKAAGFKKPLNAHVSHGK